jgi:DNA modification methylase
MRTLPDASVQCCVTSPPYYGLRDYGTAEWEGGSADCDHKKVQDEAGAISKSTLGGGKKTTGHLQEGFKDVCGHCGARRVDRQIGLEQEPDEYVARLVDVFRGVRRLLRDDGTLWLNLGDSYANVGGSDGRRTQGYALAGGGFDRPNTTGEGIKPKDLLGIPWRVAFALQADGWWLRSAIIWHKPNPMPESVRDRPTSAYEMVFLLAKSDRYFYDADAIMEQAESTGKRRDTGGTDGFVDFGMVKGRAGNRADGKRNARNVWTITPKPYKGAHFATMPIDLAARCILAGSRIGDTVLDPFGGAGTTGLAADIHQRHSVLIELNTDQYTDQAHERIVGDAPLFADVVMA